MSKVSAQELDRMILLIPRLTMRQLERLDDLIHAEKMRKLDNGKETEKEATP